VIEANRFQCAVQLLNQHKACMFRSCTTVHMNF